MYTIDPTLWKCIADDLIAKIQKFDLSAFFENELPRILKANEDSDRSNYAKLVVDFNPEDQEAFVPAMKEVGQMIANHDYQLLLERLKQSVQNFPFTISSQLFPCDGLDLTISEKPVPSWVSLRKKNRTHSRSMPKMPFFNKGFRRSGKRGQ